MGKPNFSALLPDVIVKKIDYLSQVLGINRTQVVITAIHQLCDQEKSKDTVEHIIGSFFLIFELDNSRPIAQGRVLSFLPSGNMVVQLYSWTDGRETVRRIVEEDVFSKWDFFESEEEWKLASEKMGAQLRM